MVDINNIGDKQQAFQHEQAVTEETYNAALNIDLIQINNLLANEVITGVFRDVADAIKLIGGVRKRGCPVENVGGSVNIWIIRDHDKYGKRSATELWHKYQWFYTYSRTKIVEAQKPIDTAEPWKNPRQVYNQYMTTEGEKNMDANEREAERLREEREADY